MSNSANSYLPSHRLVFSFQPRAASTSIKRALMEALGVDLDPKIIDSKQLESLNRQSASQLRDLAKHALILAFVREPAARLESCYRHFFCSGRPLKKNQRLARQLRMRPNNGSLSTFVERAVQIPDEAADHHIASMTYSTPVWHKVFRFEDGFEWDRVRAIAAERGLKLGGLGHYNKSRSYDSELTDRHRELIRDRYAADYEAFGYK